jgi:tetratricopeptide (TPR) repeat protein
VVRARAPFAAALFVAGVCLAGGPEAEPSPASPAASKVLGLLHDGRFDRARAALAGEGSGPDALFLRAFVTYWALIFDDENQVLRDTMETQLDAVLAAGDGADLAVWQGTAHLLLAELRASQRHPFAAAFEAKKAKRLLEQANESGADTSDALFGLGTYNYMADTVPAFIKGLRALLFLPGGNRERGLAQLEQAATASQHFAFESRALLVTIFANRHEKQYDRALEEARRLLQASPETGTIAALYAGARLDISLGRNGEALSFLDRADDRAAALKDVDPVVLRSLDLLRARAQFAALRPDLAALAARRALASPAGLTRDIRVDLESFAEAGEKSADGIDWSRVDSSWASAEGAAGLAALAAAAPGRPLLALLAGDAYLRIGRARDAADWLRRAESPSLSAGWVGPRLLRQGQAEDLLGQRPAALAYYRRAKDLPGFPAKDAAMYFESTPYRLGP